MKKTEVLLETKRLVLREFSREDLPAMCEVLSDPLTMPFYPHPLDRTKVAVFQYSLGTGGLKNGNEAVRHV